MEYKIIDNFLPQDTFKTIQENLLSVNFPWFLCEQVGTPDDDSDVSFTHFFYTKNKVNSAWFDDVMQPILDIVTPRSIIRARANLIVGRNEFIEHQAHADFPYEHGVFMLYLNTCNGFTRLGKDIKVDCVENRGLFFRGNDLHNSTNCTDDKKRAVITMNFF